MSALPYFPFYAKDFLADTGRLTNAEAGLYIRLLSICWVNHGRLPDNPAELRRWTGTEKNNWPRLWKRVSMFFTIVTDDAGQRWWVSSRLSLELVAAQERAEQSRVNGKKGGRPRGTQERLPLDEDQARARRPKQQDPLRGGPPQSRTPSEGVPLSASKPLKNNDLPNPTGSLGETQKKGIQNHIQNREPNGSLPPIPQRGNGKGEDRPWSFDLFWKAWPEKKGEGKARIAFHHAQMEHQNALPFEDVLASLARYRADPGTSKYMAAAKWLTEQRWKDGPTVLPPPETTGRTVARTPHRGGGFAALAADSETIEEGYHHDQHVRETSSRLPSIAGPGGSAPQDRGSDEPDRDGGRKSHHQPARRAHGR